MTTRSTKIALDDNIIRDFTVAKSFKEYDARVNSIHFSWDGMNLITSSEDDQIVIYDCERGIQKRLVNSQVSANISYRGHFNVLILCFCRLGI